MAALLRWQCRQASPTLAGNASHALLAQLCADGTAAVARDAYYALLQQECVARSAEPHSGACHALLRQQSLGRTATRPRVRAGHIDLRSSGIYTSSPAAAREPAAGAPVISRGWVDRRRGRRWTPLGHAAAIESARERRRESGPSVPQLLSQEGAELARQRVVCADCWDAPDEWRG